MCHEMWSYRRRRRAEEEGRDVWLDFERTRPIADPQAAPERTEEVRLEENERVAGVER